jgi:hypothetical protein
LVALSLNKNTHPAPRTKDGSCGDAHSCERTRDDAMARVLRCSHRVTRRKSSITCDRCVAAAQHMRCRLRHASTARRAPAGTSAALTAVSATSFHSEACGGSGRREDAFQHERGGRRVRGRDAGTLSSA